MTPAPPPEVASVFAAAIPAVRNGLIELRDLIFRTAAATPGVGPLTEALRWGQPAFLTLATRSACSLRIGPAHGGFGLFVHCRTTLIADFLAGPGAGFRTSGSRAVLFHEGEWPDQAALAPLIARALTWHRLRDHSAAL